jgi:broad specificity phosphatase PhoE
MNIILIRHGQTTSDLEDRFGGDYNDHLTAKGEEQCINLSEELKQYDIDILFHSPLHRARETAEILQEQNMYNIIPIADLKERNAYGVLSGLTKAEAKEKYPQEFAKIMKDKRHHDVLESESYDELKQRVQAILDELLNENYETISIVSHGGFLTCALRDYFKVGEFNFSDCGLLILNKKQNENQYKVIKLHNVKDLNK